MLFHSPERERRAKLMNAECGVMSDESDFIHPHSALPDSRRLRSGLGRIDSHRSNCIRVKSGSRSCIS